MDPSTQTTIGMLLITFVAIVFSASAITGAVIHHRKEEWPTHALFHTVEGAMYSQGLAGMIVILTWFPFRDGEFWSWWTIIFIAIWVHGGHLLGDALTKGGLRNDIPALGPGKVIYSLTITSMLIYAVGLALAFQHFD